MNETNTVAGRSCPLHYRYSPAVFGRTAEIVTEAIYVIGGLYGNLPAIEAIKRLAATEPAPPTLVFNGDFHWFDADPVRFAEIDDRVRSHHALRGNVETELAGEDEGYGCGCAYPDAVSDADVTRSNRILARLREVSRAHPHRRNELGALPMHAVARIGALRVGIVHGDFESLAGWRFAHNRLDSQADRAELLAGLDAAGVDIFASSHTCLPALRQIHAPQRDYWVANNGAAGMPNFRGQLHGLITRVAATPPPAGSSSHGIRIERDGNTFFVDMLRVGYDQVSWMKTFFSLWSADSPAYQSYFERLTGGPAYLPQHAWKRTPPYSSCSDGSNASTLGRRR